MANNRKVQAEIDKLLKKTSEGLEDYEELFEKFENAPNPSAKERLEADLKREIKKLQRQREQIKSFVASSEVKDTKQLEEYRKLIEKKMLEFKACEREMKTKAFSKEGLASAAAEEADSPMAQTVAWLRSAIDDGRKQIEILDYEAQRAKAGGRRGKKEQKSDAQVRLEKTQQHFHRWEALLRMLNNEELEPEEVDDLYEDIQKVLDEETDTSDIPDMDMYDAFDIPPPKPRVDPVEVAPVEEKKPSVSPGAKSAAKKTPPASVHTTATKSVSAAPAATAAVSVTSSKDVQTPGSAAKAAAPPAPASAAKALSSPPAPKPPAAAPPPAAPTLAELEADALEGNPEWLDDGMDAANDDTFGDDAMGNVTAGSLAEMASLTSKLMGPNDWESRKLELKKPSKEEKSGTTTAAKTPLATITTPVSAAAAPAPNDWEKRKLDLKKGTAPAAPASAPTAAAEAAKPAAAAAAAQAEKAQEKPQAAPAEAAKPPAPAATPIPNAAPPAGAHSSNPYSRHDAATIHRLLDMSLGNLPHTYDVERQRPYEPPNAIEPIPYFPQEVHPILSCREVYHRFDLETLFFIFYYHQKSFQQYFAAKELKSHSFRYHTELKRWYQRREKPTETTSTSERGAYTYFDFADSWQRKNVDDFTFEYKFLEDDLV